MAYPVVKQCCCGCSLETGSKTFAWLQIVLGQFLLVTGIAAELRGGGSGGGSILLGGILNIIFGTILLKGVQKKRSDYIHAWIIMSLIVLVLNIMSAIIFATILIKRIKISVLVVVVIIVYVIHIALKFYSFVVVSSLRKEMIAARNIVV